MIGVSRAYAFLQLEAGWEAKLAMTALNIASSDSHLVEEKARGKHHLCFCSKQRHTGPGIYSDFSAKFFNFASQSG